MNKETINSSPSFSAPRSALVFIVTLSLAGAWFYVEEYLLAFTIQSAIAALVIYLIVRFGVKRTKLYAIAIAAIAFSLILITYARKEADDISYAKSWIKKATPSLRKLHAGELVTDDEILGLGDSNLTQMLFVSAANQRQLFTEMENHNKNLEKLGIKKILTPEILGTDEGRKFVVENLPKIEDEIANYEKKILSQLNIAFEKLEHIASQSTGNFSLSLLRGMEDGGKQVSNSFAEISATEKTMHQNLVALSDLANRAKPILNSKGELEFKFESDSNEYRRLYGIIKETAGRQTASVNIFNKNRGNALKDFKKLSTQ